MNSTDSDRPEPSIPHLSRIETLWSVVNAGSPDRPDASAAQRQLLNRYGPSVRHYLQACLRDPDAVSGDLPLARRSWNALAEQSSGIRLDPIVKIRLWQILK